MDVRRRMLHSGVYNSLCCMQRSHWTKATWRWRHCMQDAHTASAASPRWTRC